MASKRKRRKALNPTAYIDLPIGTIIEAPLGTRSDLIAGVPFQVAHPAKNLLPRAAAAYFASLLPAKKLEELRQRVQPIDVTEFIGLSLKGLV